MTKAYTNEAEREQRLNDILLAYLEAVEAGHVPDRRQLLALYPEFASELSEFFDGRDQMEVMSAPLRDCGSCNITRTAPDARTTSASATAACVRHDSAGPG